MDIMKMKMMKMEEATTVLEFSATNSEFYDREQHLIKYLLFYGCYRLLFFRICSMEGRSDKSGKEEEELYSLEKNPLFLINFKFYFAILLIFVP